MAVPEVPFAGSFKRRFGVDEGEIMMATRVARRDSDVMANDGADRAEREGHPSPIDVHVGSRIRLRRTMFGLSQEKLGDALGLTFQQVQKYERGVNRVGASRLFDISRVLDVPISFFFEDMPEGMNDVPMSGPRGRSYGLTEAQEAFGAGLDDYMTRRETLELVRAYYRISEPSVRKRVFDLIRTLASADAFPVD